MKITKLKRERQKAIKSNGGNTKDYKFNDKGKKWKAISLMMEKLEVRKKLFGDDNWFWV